jgi:hypothetical protein
LLFIACATSDGQDGRTATVDRGIYNPVISPDGSTIAAGLMGNVWVLPVEGGEAKQLT